jgi:adenosine deaminase
MILGIKGKDHPFSLYRKFGVPVALSTDDEGVSSIDLTHEYVRAVETYELSYADLKQLVRNSLEYSFLPGPSLWSGPDYARLAGACESDAGAEKPSSACETLLRAAKRPHSNGSSSSGSASSKPDFDLSTSHSRAAARNAKRNAEALILVVEG